MITGQKVVCINDHFPLEVIPFYVRLPVKGTVYTVRDVMLGVTLAGEEGQIAITLEEIRNPVVPQQSGGAIERGFLAERFAPLQDDLVEEAMNQVRELVTNYSNAS